MAIIVNAELDFKNKQTKVTIFNQTHFVGLTLCHISVAMTNLIHTGCFFTFVFKSFPQPIPAKPTKLSSAGIRMSPKAMLAQ